MKRILSALGLICPLLAFAASFSFNRFELPLWDVSGSYHVAPSILTADGSYLQTSFDIAVTQDAKGKIIGTGVTMLDVDGWQVPANYTVLGKTVTKYGVNRAQVVVKLNGTGTILGVYSHSR